MTTLLTGANGQLGKLIAQYLQERDAKFAVSARDPRKAPPGVEVRQGDFADPAGLAETFAGVTKLILVSVDAGDRTQLHLNAVRAAAEAGVRHIIYTSVSDADTSPLLLASVHKATEEAIKDTGVAYTFLRNGMYHENYTSQLGQALPQGAFFTSAETGRLASAARADFALAAAVVASSEGHEGKVYELTGSSAWTFDEFAAAVAEVSGKTFAHRSIPAGDLTSAMVNMAGLPREVAEVFVDIYVQIGKGVLAEVRPDLEKLIGRPTTPLVDSIRAALT